LNPVGRLAAFVSVILAGALVSTVLNGFHTTILGIQFGPVDTVFTGTGLLAVAGGLYARLTLGAPAPARGHDQPAAQRTGSHAST
ncbi:MAG TPA: hypothetical protein VFN78_08740, partial [Ktedonobacterales bacterium]|nr:hypothetical protein [Ktedonobacterales bacterium]